MNESPSTHWLTVPDLTELLGLKVSQVRRLIEEGALLASKIDGVWQVPDVFIVDGAPLRELRGTVVVLSDAGFSSDESMNWLLTSEPSLGVSPVEALRAGRKAEVRRVAQALGF
ncbi:Rv2175c family DNA-binding protein [Salinibacterium sp. SWN1162]|uniref:Rv2175c family DNA-binding protein n=1 Tax=Salinibacterium sp. SWN1162 TaxID=2792053 RepID=UPI0018CE7BFA|nr:Rv2175c family DNA-binding protein [Salinibacterium sp. SWN1162]MBH0009482.1 DNA-binding protein [Salinibacterium sp. SWN1162]